VRNCNLAILLARALESNPKKSENLGNSMRSVSTVRRTSLDLRGIIESLKNSRSFLCPGRLAHLIRDLFSMLGSHEYELEVFSKN
jgi:hypothetical protein